MKAHQRNVREVVKYLVMAFFSLTAILFIIYVIYVSYTNATDRCAGILVKGQFTIDKLGVEVAGNLTGSEFPFAYDVVHTNKIRIIGESSQTVHKNFVIPVSLEQKNHIKPGDTLTETFVLGRSGDLYLDNTEFKPGQVPPTWLSLLKLSMLLSMGLIFGIALMLFLLRDSEKARARV